MGRPKQLIEIDGRPLVRRVAEAAVAARFSPAVIVLGAYAERIAPAFEGLPLQIAINDGWEEGLGSSIRTGVAAVLNAAPEVGAIILTLADQPSLHSTHLRRLHETHRLNSAPIVASELHGIPTPPALFAPIHFPALLSLRGDIGARSLLASHPAQLIPAPDLADIDTPEDAGGLETQREEPDART